jgi:hypothetical protein
MFDRNLYSGGAKPELWYRTERLQNVTAVTDAPIRFQVTHRASTGRSEQMTTYKQYRRTQVAEMRPYQRGDDLNGVSISDVDRNAGTPKPGDMIARRITPING